MRLTHDKDNLDETVAETASGSIQLTTTEIEQALMLDLSHQPMSSSIEATTLLSTCTRQLCSEKRCVKLRSMAGFGDTGLDLVNALLNGGVSLTDVEVGDLTCSEDTKLARCGDT